MSELREVLTAIRDDAASAERMALATVVGVTGSTYRQPGARLLVRSRGTSIGNISGGCLEGDVERALLSMAVYIGDVRLIDNMLVGEE